MDPGTIAAIAGQAGEKVGGIASFIYQIIKDQHLTGAQREANAFTAEQNQRAMDFSAGQALQQMDFQERMANSQYQRGVADMRAAGVNPALAYQQGGAVAPSGAMASGSAGSSVDPGRGMSLSDMLQAISFKKQMKLIDAQANAAQAQANQSNANANRIEKEASWIDSLNNVKVQSVIKSMQLDDARITNFEYQNSLTEARELEVLKNVSWIDDINNAKTVQMKASAARDYAEAAISQYERQLGHRLGSSQTLALATAIMSALGIDATSPLGETVAKSVKDYAEKSKDVSASDYLPAVESNGHEYTPKSHRGFY